MDSEIKLNDKYISTTLSEKTCVIQKEHYNLFKKKKVNIATNNLYKISI